MIPRPACRGPDARLALRPSTARRLTATPAPVVRQVRGVMLDAIQAAGARALRSSPCSRATARLR